MLIRSCRLGSRIIRAWEWRHLTTSSGATVSTAGRRNLQTSPDEALPSSDERLIPAASGHRTLRKRVSASSPPLPLPPLLDPHVQAQRSKHRAPKPERAREKLSAFQQELAANPDVQALSTPLRRDVLADFLAPRHFLQRFEAELRPREEQPLPTGRRREARAVERAGKDNDRDKAQQQSNDDHVADEAADTPDAAERGQREPDPLSRSSGADVTPRKESTGRGSDQRDLLRKRFTPWIMPAFPNARSRNHQVPASQIAKAGVAPGDDVDDGPPTSICSTPSRRSPQRKYHGQGAYAFLSRAAVDELQGKKPWKLLVGARTEEAMGRKRKEFIYDAGEVAGRIEAGLVREVAGRLEQAARRGMVLPLGEEHGQAAERTEDGRRKATRAALFVFDAAGRDGSVEMLEDYLEGLRRRAGLSVAEEHVYFLPAVVGEKHVALLKDTVEEVIRGDISKASSLTVPQQLAASAVVISLRAETSKAILALSRFETFYTNETADAEAKRRARARWFQDRMKKVEHESQTNQASDEDDTNPFGQQWR